MKAARATFRAMKFLAMPIVLGILFLVCRHIGFGRIVAAARRMDRPTITVAAALHMVVFLLWCLRWQQLMRPENRKSVFALLPIYMAGVFGNVVTPGARVGGEPIRAYYMSRAFGGQKTAYLGTILADKAGNGAVFLLFLLLSVNFVVLFVGISLAPKLAMLAVVLLVVAAVIVLVLLRRRVKGAVLSLRKLLPLLYRSRPMRFLRLQFATCEEFEDGAILLTPVVSICSMGPCPTIRAVRASLTPSSLPRKRAGSTCSTSGGRKASSAPAATALGAGSPNAAW